MAVDLALILKVQEEGTAALKSMQSTLQGMEQQSNATGASFLKLSGSFAVGEIAARAAIGTISALATTVAGAVKSTIDLSSSLEQTRIGLTVMLGSGSKANAMLADLQNFAENTSFNFPGLADAAKRLLAMGFTAQDVIPVMGDVANAVGAVGGGKEVLDRVVLALGQMQAKGKVSSEEMRQLAEAGIPVWTLLAQAIGKTTEQTMKLVENREISSGTFFEAFHKFSQEKWGDIQAQQARTFSGAMSNVQDVLGRLAVAGFSNLFDALTVGANLLYQFLKTDQVKQWAADFNASVGVVLQALAPLGDALKSILGIGNGGGAAASVAAQAAAPAAAITATVAAGAGAAKEAIAGLDAQAREVNQTIHGINQEMTALNEQSAALKFKIEDVKQGFEDQLRPLKDVHDELQRAAQDAKAGFDQFLLPLKDALDETKRKIADIKDGYNDQIAAVKSQIDAIQGANDELRKQEDIQNAIYDAQLRAEALAAQGDPVAKAKLQNKLDDIGFDRNHIANQIQLLELKNKHGENDKKIAALKREQNELDAKAIGVREKIAGLVDRVALAEIKKKEALQAQEKAQQGIARAQENLDKQKELDPLKQQAKDLAAQRDAAVAPLEATAKGLQRMYDSVKHQQEEALAAIEAKQRDNERAIQDTEAAQRKVLEPLEAQAKVLERQRSELQLSAQHWQGIKQNISDAKAELEAAAKAAKESGLAPGGPGIGGKPGAVSDPRDRGIVPPSANVPKPFDVGGALAGVLAGIAAGIPKIVEKLEEWATPFGEWLGPMIPRIPGKIGDFVLGIGNWIIQNVPQIIDKLGHWAMAFIDWVQPQIDPLIHELGGLLARMTGWLIDALPEIVGNLAKWAWEFVAWVAPKIPDLIIELEKLLADFGKWIVFTALPAIVKKISGWSAAFLDWIKDDVVPNLPEKLDQIKDSIGTWAEGSGGMAVKAYARLIGVGFLVDMAEGVKEKVDWFKDWLKENFVDKLPEWVRDWLDIKSPSGVFREIGHQMIAGLQHGISKKFPDVQALMAKLIGGITGGGAVQGNVTEWLKAAIGITGVPDDWMKGLQKLVMFESGGNPMARNPEAVRGPNGENYGHATGLLQMLPGTFGQYAMKNMRDIFNPIHNAVASIRYILDTYGTVYNIRGIGRPGQFPGYATGGVVPNDGVAMLHRNEMVLTPQRQQQLLRGNVTGGSITIAPGAIVISSNQPPMAIAEMVRAELIKIARRNGYSALGGYA